jgi:hypothetical protein
VHCNTCLRHNRENTCMVLQPTVCPVAVCCCTPQPALLVYLRGSGTWWLNSAVQTPSPELRQAYWAMGWLMAQAVTNRCTLGLPVAPLLFHLLLSPDDTLQVRMQDMDGPGVTQH